jgi:hypothetical protein
MTCKYELMSNSNGLTVDAAGYIAQVDPSNNPKFKKIDNNTYVCDTTINHPEACVSYDAVSPRIINDATGGSVEEK